MTVSTRDVDYDFIVVGGGSSGCAVASRLTRRGLNVLLIEEGSLDAYRHWSVKRPHHWFVAATKGPPVSRLWETVPQKHLNGRRIPCWNGRGGGGSSLINATMYLRGRQSDYQEHWPWNLQDIQKSMESIEAEYGLEQDEVTVAGAAQMETLQQAGLRVADNTDAWSREGIQAQPRATTRNGYRLTAWEALINPVLSMPNITVMDDTAVARVLVEGGRAVGLEVLKGRKESARVHLRFTSPQAEVILCAGVFNSPRILMLSGLGPASHLRNVGVPLVQDLPHVGENLQDHTLLGTMFRSKIPIDKTTCGATGQQIYGNVTLSNGKKIQLLHGSAWETPVMVPEMSQMNLRKGGFWMTLLRQLLVWLLKVAMMIPVLRHSVRQGTGCNICLVDPSSRGTVRLRSRDPRDAPVIDPRFMSQEDEWETLWLAVQMLRGVQQTPEAQKWHGQELMPGKKYNYAKDRVSMRRWAGDYMLSYFHPVGTCRMGESAQDSVVHHNNLKVHGIQGLRVADASVAPKIVSTNTQAMCMMIGDRAAELIWKDQATRDRAGMRAADAEGVGRL